MRNIIRAQFYQMRKEKLPTIAFWGLLAVTAVNGFTGLGDGLLTGSEFSAGGLQFTSMIASLYVFIQTAMICGSDFKDKTSNYEIMSGHLRWECYFGRVIPCMVTGIIGWLLIAAAPLVVSTALCGWGTKIPLWNIALRMLLMVFPIARLICEFVFFTFLFKNPYAAMGLGYMAFCIGGISPAFSNKGSFFLGMTNITKLTLFDTWYTYGLETDVNYIYEYALKASDIWGTVAASVIIGGAALYLGYVFFRNDDMN